MKIIAESGSTKTDWAIIDDKNILHQYSTPGFNPVYFPPEVLESRIREIIPSLNCNEITAIYFYGTGCSTPEPNSMVQAILKKYFPKVQKVHCPYGVAQESAEIILKMLQKKSIRNPVNDVSFTG